MSLVSDAVGRTTQFKVTEVYTDAGASGEAVSASPGSETMACLNIGVMRAPGRPCRSLRANGSMPDNRRGRKAKGARGVGWSNSTEEGG
jgi:hypothetical protein